MATDAQKLDAIENLREALRAARDRYVLARNAASEAQWAKGRPILERELAERRADAATEEKAIYGAVGAVAAAVAYVPIVGQILAAVIVVAAALYRASQAIGEAFGKVNRTPGDPLPVREGYELHRGFDREAWRWLHPNDIDVDFAALVDRRLWALSQISEIDFDGAFPRLPTGQIVRRPYLVDAFPEVSDQEAQDAADRRARAAYAARRDAVALGGVSLPTAEDTPPILADQAPLIYPVNIARERVTRS